MQQCFYLPTSIALGKMFLNNEQSSYSPRHTHISGAQKRTLGFTTQRILPAYMCIRSPDTDRKLASRGQPAGLEEAISHQSSDSTPYRSTSVCCVPICVCTSVRRVVLCCAPNSNLHCVRTVFLVSCYTQNDRILSLDVGVTIAQQMLGERPRFFFEKRTTSPCYERSATVVAQQSFSFRAADRRVDFHRCKNLSPTRHEICTAGSKMSCAVDILRMH